MFILGSSEDSCPEGSIDLKCKERVTDSDEDEPDGQVGSSNTFNYYSQSHSVADIVCLGHLRLILMGNHASPSPLFCAARI